MPDNPIFGPVAPLPRGPHGLAREAVAESQRTRLMRACTDLVAARGYADVTVGDLARGAGVSRASFYEHFTDKQDCVLAAYDHFALVLRRAMTADLGEQTTWTAFIDTAVSGYLGTLQRDRAAARAFVVELDAAGAVARERRRTAVHGFAAMIATRHAAIRASDATLGPLDATVHLALALGIREVVRDALETGTPADLNALAPSILLLVAAVVEGAAAAGSDRPLGG